MVASLSFSEKKMEGSSFSPLMMQKYSEDIFHSNKEHTNV